MRKPPRKPMVVREPVQVYLAQPDRVLLDMAAKKAGVSRAELLRRGLRLVGGEVMNEESPMLSFLDRMSAAPAPKGTPNDIAANHDDYLADIHLDRHSAKKK